MRYAWRTLLVLGVFVGIFLLTTKLVWAHTVQMGTPRPEVRLAALMAGLFSGGAAACLVGIATIWGRPKA